MTTAHESQRIFALPVAVLFGPGTSFAKQLVGSLWPILLAGMLYLGSGVGLVTSAKSVPLTKVLRHNAAKRQ